MDFCTWFLSLLNISVCSVVGRLVICLYDLSRFLMIRLIAVHPG